MLSKYNALCRAEDPRLNFQDLAVPSFLRFTRDKEGRMIPYEFCYQLTKTEAIDFIKNSMYLNTEWIFENVTLSRIWVTQKIFENFEIIATL